jgi:hypothetical protein
MGADVRPAPARASIFSRGSRRATLEHDVGAGVRRGDASCVWGAGSRAGRRQRRRGRRAARVLFSPRRRVQLRRSDSCPQVLRRDAEPVVRVLTSAGSTALLRSACTDRRPAETSGGDREDSPPEVMRPLRRSPLRCPARAIRADVPCRIRCRAESRRSPRRCVSAPGPASRPCAPRQPQVSDELRADR